MPLPVIPDVFRVALDWETTADTSLRATNVLHFRAPEQTATDVLDALFGTIDADMWRTTSTTCELVTATCWPLDGTSLAEERAGLGTADWKGSQSAGQIAPQVATVVTFKTAKRGKSYRGRCYVPWVAEAATDAGTVVEAQAALMETAWSTFRAQMVLADCALVVASYLLEDAELVTGVAVRRRTGTIRRRQPR